MTQRYLVVIEGDEHTNFSAYSPDVPGVVATGDSRTSCAAEMRQAIAFHLEGLASTPRAVSTAAYVDVEVG